MLTYLIAAMHRWLDAREKKRRSNLCASVRPERKTLVAPRGRFNMPRATGAHVKGAHVKAAHVKGRMTGEGR